MSALAALAALVAASAGCWEFEDRWDDPSIAIPRRMPSMRVMLASRSAPGPSATPFSGARDLPPQVAGPMLERNQREHEDTGDRSARVTAGEGVARPTLAPHRSSGCSTSLPR